MSVNFDCHIYNKKLREQTCSICLEGFQRNQDLYSHDSSKDKTDTLFHIFHSNCIAQWLGNKPACPNCNVPVHKLSDKVVGPFIPENPPEAAESYRNIPEALNAMLAQRYPRPPRVIAPLPIDLLFPYRNNPIAREIETCMGKLLKSIVSKVAAIVKSIFNFIAYIFEIFCVTLVVYAIMDSAITIAQVLST